MATTRKSKVAFIIIIKRHSLLSDMLELSTTLSYYKRRDVQEAIFRSAESREVAIRFQDSFGRRPDVISNPHDILEFAKQKATSFHCSEELWKNPLQLSPEMKKQDTESLRLGWDLVLDIDCAVFEYSRIAADLVIKALKFNGVKAISCKFSGNKGFHIGVPFESFPGKVSGKEVRNMFPEAPRRIAAYISYLIEKKLEENIIAEDNDISTIARKVGKDESQIAEKKRHNGNEVYGLKVKEFLEIDTLLISSRHLFRMPYSLHEKSSLVSIPINPEKIIQFEKELAKPEKAKISEFAFLDRSKSAKNDASELLMNAFDFNPAGASFEVIKKEYAMPQEAVPEELFPPCIKLGLKGLTDGRKRFLFALINFLVSSGWDYDSIEKRLEEWNKANPEPLRMVNIKGQLRYHKQQGKKILPPNCSNMAYYVDIGICKPDNLCAKIKNPVSYSQRKTMFSEKAPKKAKKEAETIDMRGLNAGKGAKAEQ